MHVPNIVVLHCQMPLNSQISMRLLWRVNTRMIRTLKVYNNGKVIKLHMNAEAGR